ncbi:MAG: trigger factor [Persephonella sp.]|nr:MAG: trigger factor [Persephonella sp.]
MVVNVEEKGLLRIITIDAEGNEVSNLVKEVIKEIKKNVNIPGFRKGQIPDSVIRARYKDTIKEEVAKRFINENFQKIVEENNITPVSPEVSFGDIELNGNKLKLKLSFEVAPEFELKDYKGIEVEVIKKEVEDKDIEEAINKLLNQYAKYEPADKQIENGDKIKIHYKITTDKGETEEDTFEVIVGENQLRQEIEKEILGKKKGDEIEVKDVSLYNEKGEEFGKATVNVKIEEVYKKVLPEFNDEFVKEIGLAENVEEAKKKIFDSLKQSIENAKKVEIENKITEKLLKENDFELPQSLVKAELNYLIQEYAKQLENMGLKPSEDMLMGVVPSLEEQAKKNVKLMFIVNKIAELENIKVEDEEINKEIEEMAKVYNTTPEQLKEYLEKEGLINNIIYGILKRKVFDFLRKNANIKEIEEKEEVKEETKQEVKEEAQQEEKKEEKTTKKRGRRKKKEDKEKESEIEGKKKGRKSKKKEEEK